MEIICKIYLSNYLFNPNRSLGMPTMEFLPAPMALVRGWVGEWRNYLWRYNK